ncbi:unnamed protein product [Somion occarium]|uniref:Uncharacterized protein n=1 Tax=Somion occarium TaxID=3059160 RepID=A0ABP1CZK2_9APHY
MDFRNTHYSSDAGACYIVQVLRINATTELVRSFVLWVFAHTSHPHTLTQLCSFLLPLPQVSVCPLSVKLIPFRLAFHPASCKAARWPPFEVIDLFRAPPPAYQEAVTHAEWVELKVWECFHALPSFPIMYRMQVVV